MTSASGSIQTADQVRLVMVASHKYLDRPLATVDQANSNAAWKDLYLAMPLLADNSRGRAVELADGQCQYRPVKRYGLELWLLVVGERKDSRQPFDLKMIVMPHRTFAADYLELDRLVADMDMPKKSDLTKNLRQGLSALPEEMWRHIVSYLTPKERYEIRKSDSAYNPYLHMTCEIALNEEEMFIFKNQDNAIEHEMEEGITRNPLIGEAR